MSSFEQRVEPADKRYQYLLFACDPYEIIAFKIPNEPIDKQEGRFVSNWDKETKKFTLQLYFVEDDGMDKDTSETSEPEEVQERPVE
eukprot:scaffold613_cov243-Pinguiococcus_pyrenoidosus.AAC.16